MNAVNSDPDAGEQGLTQRETRARLGCSLGKVNRLVQDRELDLLPNGRVSEASVEAYLSRQPASVPPPPPRNTAGATAAAARAELQGTVAKLRGLDYAERVGQLTATADVDAAHTTLARTLRDALLALPAELAPALINIPESRQVEATLRRALTQFLAGQAAALHAEPAPA